MNQPIHTAAPTAVSHMPNRKAVNIIAMGSSRNDFFQAQLMEMRPDILQNAEIWTINYMGGAIRCDRIIHVDPVHEFLGHPIVRDMCEYALKDNIPLYTSHPHPKFPNHVIYPFDRVSAALGGITYFNTSVAYAIALAMADGFNEIGLFGCDFSYPDVHIAESGRACCEFLMGIGTQRGIRFVVAQSSTLMDMYNGQQPYGWFANPNHIPAQGGKLMNAPQILQHIERHRNPPKIRDLIQTVASPAPLMGFGGGTIQEALAKPAAAWSVSGSGGSGGAASSVVSIDQGALEPGQTYSVTVGRPHFIPKPNGHDTAPNFGVAHAPDSVQLPHGNGG